MQPRTVSASSLATWEECPAKYRAHYIERVPESGKKTAADKGSVVHYALQHFVDEVYLQKTEQWSNKARLMELLRVGFKDIMKRAPLDTDEDWLDCVGMTENWYGRTDLTGREILSVEAKHQYELPALSGKIPLTFIMDRLDMVRLPNGKVEFHVVDYKSQQMAESFEDIENKLQAQIYALAVYLWYGYKGGPYEGLIESVWVHLDLLRHSEVGVEFTREDCEKLYLWLLEQVDVIRAMPDADAPEILGPHCNWCARKGACGSLKKARSNGSFIGMEDLQQMVDLRQEMNGQVKGLTALVKELDGMINRTMKEQQITRIQTGQWTAEWDTGKGKRVINTEDAAKVLGAELIARIAKLNITAIDALLKGDEIDDAQKMQLKALIGYEYDTPGVKMKKTPVQRTPRKK